MPKPIIDAQEALDLIRAGKTDAELTAKYNLSLKGLQSLFSKLVRAGALTESDLANRCPDRSACVGLAQGLPSGREGLSRNTSETQSTSGERVIRAVDAIRDILAGLNDSEMMEKYKLSAKGLQDLINQLVAADLITQYDVERRAFGEEQSVDLLHVIRRLGMDAMTGLGRANSHVPSRCVACGASQTAEFDECPVCGVNIPEFKARKLYEERLATAVWKCPSCGKPQDKEYDECPACGVIVSKVKKSS